MDLSSRFRAGRDRILLALTVFSGWLLRFAPCGITETAQHGMWGRGLFGAARDGRKTFLFSPAIPANSTVWRFGQAVVTDNSIGGRFLENVRGGGENEKIYVAPESRVRIGSNTVPNRSRA